MALRWLILVSLPVLLLSFLFAPSPRLLLGDDIGRLVEIARSMAKISIFMRLGS